MSLLFLLRSRYQFTSCIFAIRLCRINPLLFQSRCLHLVRRAQRSAKTPGKRFFPHSGIDRVKFPFRSRPAVPKVFPCIGVPRPISDPMLQNIHLPILIALSAINLTYPPAVKEFCEELTDGPAVSLKQDSCTGPEVLPISRSGFSF